MQRIAFLLAIQFAVLSTQPVWQPLGRALFGSCGVVACVPTAMACAAAPTLPCSPSGNEGSSDAANGCCAPFQCCFACFCYCQQPAHLPEFAGTNKNTRPSEETKALHSTNLQEHFQPPEMG